MIFPLHQPCGVFRVFLEIRNTPELKSYITFLRTPQAISGRKIIEVNFVTLCHIFTMSRSPYRDSLLRGSNVIVCETISVTFTTLDGSTRPPIVHTCGPTLELPSTYQCYNELAEVFMALRNAKDS